MKIVVHAAKPLFEEELQATFLYDCSDQGFAVEAGGYLLGAQQDFEPLTIRTFGDAIAIKFQAKVEAEAFIEWLRRANRDAEESFTRMLD